MNKKKQQKPKKSRSSTNNQSIDSSIKSYKLKFKWFTNDKVDKNYFWKKLFFAKISATQNQIKEKYQIDNSF